MKQPKVTWEDLEKLCKVLELYPDPKIEKIIAGAERKMELVHQYQVLKRTGRVKVTRTTVIEERSCPNEVSEMQGAALQQTGRHAERPAV